MLTTIGEGYGNGGASKCRDVYKSRSRPPIRQRDDRTQIGNLYFQLGCCAERFTEISFTTLCENAETKTKPFLQIRTFQDKPTGQVVLSFDNTEDRDAFFKNYNRDLPENTVKAGRTTIEVAIDNIDKGTPVTVLQHDSKRVYGRHMDTILCFDMDQTISSKTAVQARNIKKNQIFPEIIQEWLRLLRQDPNMGIVINTGGNAEDKAGIIREMIASLKTRADKKLCCERLKLVANGGTVMVDFERRVVHSHGRSYWDVQSVRSRSYDTLKSGCFSGRPFSITKVICFDDEPKGNGRPQMLEGSVAIQVTNPDDTLAHLRRIGRLSINPIQPATVANFFERSDKFKEAVCCLWDLMYKYGNSHMSIDSVANARMNTQTMSYRNTVTYVDPSIEGIKKIPLSCSQDDMYRDKSISELRRRLQHGGTRLTANGGAIDIDPMASPEDVCEALFIAMEKNPTLPVVITIKGNNHYWTHEKLPAILREITSCRGTLNHRMRKSVHDLLVISGDRSGSSPYSAMFPAGSIRHSTGDMGSRTEADCIYDVLKPDKPSCLRVIRDTASQNTGQNIENIATILEKEGIQDYIVVDIQSGPSGIRSGLTTLGPQNPNQSRINSLFCLNPDLSSVETSSLSYAHQGQLIIQMLREVTNFLGYQEREIYLALLDGYPRELVDSYLSILSQLGISGDTSLKDVFQLLNEANTLCRDRVEIVQESYADECETTKETSFRKRGDQDLMQFMFDRLKDHSKSEQRSRCLAVWGTQKTPRAYWTQMTRKRHPGG